MWCEPRLAYQGATVSFPERAVLPKPVQRPHPPLWVTVTTPGTELDAAERGIGCLGVAAAGFQEQERRTAEYRKRIQQCNPVSSVVNDRVSTLNWLYCHEDDATAVRVGGQMFGAFTMLNSHLAWTREMFPTRAYQSLGNLAPGAGNRRRSEDPGEQRPVPDGVGIGDPDRIVDAVKVWESVGVDEINFLLNTTEVIPHEQVLDSLRLFAREVMPHFAGAGAGGAR
jgi:alkanesulfonate monooxygenase SsuD/methylene tetrahydromethanopterin reductase-like flavin-dependent oxidoreductase (luciferase family)